MQLPDFTSLQLYRFRDGPDPDTPLWTQSENCEYFDIVNIHNFRSEVRFAQACRGNDVCSHSPGHRESWATLFIEIMSADYNSCFNLSQQNEVYMREVFWLSTLSTMIITNHTWLMSESRKVCKCLWTSTPTESRQDPSSPHQGKYLLCPYHLNWFLFQWFQSSDRSSRGHTQQF